jgi:hypothetical protein
LIQILLLLKWRVGSKGQPEAIRTSSGVVPESGGFSLTLNFFCILTLFSCHISYYFQFARQGTVIKFSIYPLIQSTNERSCNDTPTGTWLPVSPQGATPVQGYGESIATKSQLRSQSETGPLERRAAKTTALGASSFLLGRRLIILLLRLVPISSRTRISPTTLLCRPYRRVAGELQQGL